MTMQQIVDRAKNENRALLTEVESKELLKKVGIDVVDTRLAASAEEAAALSEEIGFPMVLKIASVDMVHNSDVGGVNMGLETPQQVASAYSEIMSAIGKSEPRARIQGVSLQRRWHVPALRS